MRSRASCTSWLLLLTTVVLTCGALDRGHLPKLDPQDDHDLPPDSHQPPRQPGGFYTPEEIDSHAPHPDNFPLHPESHPPYPDRFPPLPESHPPNPESHRPHPGRFPHHPELVEGHPSLPEVPLWEDGPSFSRRSSLSEASSPPPPPPPTLPADRKRRYGSQGNDQGQIRGPRPDQIADLMKRTLRREGRKYSRRMTLYKGLRHLAKKNRACAACNGSQPMGGASKPQTPANATGKAESGDVARSSVKTDFWDIVAAGVEASSRHDEVLEGSLLGSGKLHGPSPVSDVHPPRKVNPEISANKQKTCVHEKEDDEDDLGPFLDRKTAISFLSKRRPLNRKKILLKELSAMEQREAEGRGFGETVSHHQYSPGNGDDRSLEGLETNREMLPTPRVLLFEDDREGAVGFMEELSGSRKSPREREDVETSADNKMPSDAGDGGDGGEVDDSFLETSREMMPSPTPVKDKGKNSNFDEVCTETNQDMERGLNKRKRLRPEDIKGLLRDPLPIMQILKRRAQRQRLQRRRQRRRQKQRRKQNRRHFISKHNKANDPRKPLQESPSGKGRIIRVMSNPRRTISNDKKPQSERRLRALKHRLAARRYNSRKKNKHRRRIIQCARFYRLHFPPSLIPPWCRNRRQRKEPKWSRRRQQRGRPTVPPSMDPKNQPVLRTPKPVLPAEKESSRPLLVNYDGSLHAEILSKTTWRSPAERASEGRGATPTTDAGFDLSSAATETLPASTGTLASTTTTVSPTTPAVNASGAQLAQDRDGRGEKGGRVPVRTVIRGSMEEDRVHEASWVELYRPGNHRDAGPDSAPVYVRVQYRQQNPQLSGSQAAAPISHGRRMKRTVGDDQGADYAGENDDDSSAVDDGDDNNMPVQRRHRRRRIQRRRQGRERNRLNRRRRPANDNNDDEDDADDASLSQNREPERHHLNHQQHRTERTNDGSGDNDDDDNDAVDAHAANAISVLQVVHHRQRHPHSEGADDDDDDDDDNNYVSIRQSSSNNRPQMGFIQLAGSRNGRRSNGNNRRPRRQHSRKNGRRQRQRRPHKRQGRGQGRRNRQQAERRGRQQSAEQSPPDNVDSRDAGSAALPVGETEARIPSRQIQIVGNNINNDNFGQDQEDAEAHIPSPFINHRTAYDFLSTQARSRTRGRARRGRGDNEQQTEQWQFNHRMSESMCEVFDKHFVPTSLGGRCV